LSFINDREIVTEGHPAADAGLLTNDRRIALREAIAALPDRDQQLLSLLCSDPDFPTLRSAHSSAYQSEPPDPPASAASPGYAEAPPSQHSWRHERAGPAPRSLCQLGRALARLGPFDQAANNLDHAAAQRAKLRDTHNEVAVQLAYSLSDCIVRRRALGPVGGGRI
jgi:hypothetical protein